MNILKPHVLLAAALAAVAQLMRLLTIVGRKDNRR